MDVWNVFFLAGLWIWPKVQADPPGIVPLLMVGDPVPCCLGKANGEKLKYEGIVEFSRLRCEDEQDAMKPMEILHGEGMYLTGQQSCAGITLASVL